MKKYEVRLNDEHYGYIFAKSLKAAKSQVLKNYVKSTLKVDKFVFNKMKNGVVVHKH